MVPSPSRRAFLAAAGAGWLPTRVPDPVPDHPFVPRAAVEWSFDAGGGSAGLPEFADGRAYVTRPGVVIALSARGSEQWRYPVDAGRPGVVVGPEWDYLEDERTVYVDVDGAVHALDPAADGRDYRVKWRYEGDGRPSTLLATNRTAVVLDGDIRGLSVLDGDVEWRFDPDGGMWQRPHYDGRTVYVGTTAGTLHALSPVTGEGQWRARVPADGAAYALAVDATADRAFAWESNEGRLVAVDADDGREYWGFEAVGRRGRFPGTVTDDTVFVTDAGGLHALSAADGRQRWRYDAGEWLHWRPVVDGDAVYVGSHAGVLAVADGRRRWRTDAGTVAVGVAGDTLVTRDEGTVYGVGTGDGRLRWTFAPDAPLSWRPRVHGATTYLATGSGAVHAVSDPGPTPVRDALRNDGASAALGAAGLLGGALAVRLYRGRTPVDAGTDESATPTALDDFELRGLLAESDRGTVHEALGPDGSRVALKRLAPDALAPGAFAAAVRTWADLDVDGVLAVLAWDTDPRPWVATRLGDANVADANLSVDGLVHAVADAAEVVHGAHRAGVAHGRLVAGNVVLVDGDVRVGDWRLAARLRGPPTGYAPPEDDPDVAVADVYQLGALAYDLLVGTPPTPDPAPPTEREPSLPDELDEVLGRALAPDPADRHGSALALADALRWTVRN